MKPCEWCDNTFDPSVTYQIYCSSECRQNATRQKIAERYANTQRLKRKTSPRLCEGGCGVTLSMYNDNRFCNNCNINDKEVKKRIKQLKGLMNGKDKFK